VGGLYGFSRGATQFWLSTTGSVEMVMRMGVSKPNSTRFLFYVLNSRCRGTFRARIVSYYREDLQDLAERLEELVVGFMKWLKARVIDLYEEGQGNVFAGGFAIEVAAKVMTMVDVLLRTQAGMIEAGVA